MISLGVDLIFMDYDKKLVRDPTSQALINKDKAGLERAKALKAAKRKEKNRIDELENRIEFLETGFQALELKFREYIYRHTDDGK